LKKSNALAKSTPRLDHKFIFPIVGRDEARRSAVREVVSRFFNESPELLVLNILEHEKIDTEELARLKQMIQESV